MPNSPTTLASSAVETTGTPIPLSYGYVWATGKRQAYFMLQNTGRSTMDYVRMGFWLLGHGEWDGPQERWINDKLVLRASGGFSAVPPAGFSGQQWLQGLDGRGPLVWNFHSGCDAQIGLDLTTFNSNGPDQGLDVLWPLFPPAINRLPYSRIAYYTIMRKQPIDFQTNTHQNDPSQWTDINPIGLWRALRCRIFDANGNVTGYAFTTNPAWHWVDVLLRRLLFPEYNIDVTNGPDPLPAAISARFDWATIADSAAYFDELLANGRRRFSGNYSFTSQSTLQAALTQIQLCCRSYSQEYAGKLQLICDKPRASVFTFDRTHIMPGSFDFNDQPLHTSANRYVAKFRDLLVPAAVGIVSISCPDHGNPQVTFDQPHPFDTQDWIVMGGTNSVYDGEWQVESVPAVTNPGTPQEVDPTTCTLIKKGSNFPTSVGAGGYAGLLQARFKERAPEFWHKANMLARGALGVAITRLRQKVRTELDFATCTYDQAARIATYERDRALGVDTAGTNGQLATPYVTPPAGKLRTSLFARDKFGNLACAIRPGDRVTIDPTLSATYAGDYEVRDPLTVYPPTAAAGSGADDIVLRPAQNSGEIEFTLGTYNEAVMYDVSDQTAAGWLNVPGSDPGNDENFTQVDLANGVAAFFSGSGPSGSQFQLPSSGFSPGNLLSWGSPQGYIELGAVMHVITLCDADANRNLTLNYQDGQNDVWHGPVNFFGATWRSADVVSVSGGITWLQLTLLGGEIILLGMGVVADGTVIALPAGFTAAQCFAWASPHDASPTEPGATGNQATGVSATVDPATLTVHLTYEDNESHIWHGNAKVLLFAWKNNMGTVVTETVGGVNWMHAQLTNGRIFGAGLGRGLAPGANFALPAAAGDGSSLQAIATPSGWTLPEPNPAHGVGACFLDGSNDVVAFFEDGQGHKWNSNADVFGVFYSLGTQTAKTIVAVTPQVVTMAAGTLQHFIAQVIGIANQSVTWSVDGILGGNLTVGTIDANGNYTAPAQSGQHLITATSIGDPTASVSASVTVVNDILTGNVLTDDFGNVIYDANGNAMLAG